MGFYEEDLRNELPFSSYPQYTVSTCLIAIDTDLNHLAEIVFVKFLHCKVIFFLFPYSLEGSRCTAHT